jgi:hypothetical protein
MLLTPTAPGAFFPTAVVFVNGFFCPPAAMMRQRSQGELGADTRPETGWKVFGLVFVLPCQYNTGLQ